MFRRIPPPPRDNMGQRGGPRTKQQQQQYHRGTNVDDDDDDEYYNNNIEEDPHASLVQSVTAEDDDDEYAYKQQRGSNSSINNNKKDQQYLSHGALVQQVRNNSGNKNNRRQNHRQAVAYLLRYETMVRQQEAEDMATMAHLRPCFERIMQLLGHHHHHDNNDNESLAMRSTVSDWSNDDNDSSTAEYDDDNDESFWKQEISFADLQKALIIMESSPSSSLSTPEFMTTDRQLLMVLRLLAQNANDHHARDDASTSCSGSSQSVGAGDENSVHHGIAQDEDSSNNNNADDDDVTVMITWAEVMQCYKVCVAGMHVLQHLPALSSANNNNMPIAVAGAADCLVPVHDIIRTRARDRTLTMLSLFEPNSTRLFTDKIDNYTNSKCGAGAGLARSSSLVARCRTAAAHQRGVGAVATARGGREVTAFWWEETVNVCMSKWKQTSKRQRGIAMLILVAILLVITTFCWNRSAIISSSQQHQQHSRDGTHSATRSMYSTNQHQQPQMLQNPVIYNKSPTPIVSSNTKTRKAARNPFYPLYTTQSASSPLPSDPNNLHHCRGGSISTPPASTQCATTTTNAPFTSNDAHGLGKVVGSGGAADLAVLQPAIVGAVLGAPVIVATVQLAMSGLATGSLFSTLVCGAGVVSLISVAFRAVKHWLARFTMIPISNSVDTSTS